VTFTYAAVDQSPDPAQAVVWQERLNDRPAIRTYKERTYELVAGAEPILDVGCGPGTDAAALGMARVLGLDPSSAMCRRASTRGVTVCRGEAGALPFADQTFDACRADRVLQHLADPSAALDELIRVIRPGGRVVVADPDQESLTLHVPGVSDQLTDQVRRLRRDVGYRNGRLASHLPELLTIAGLTDITVEAFPLVITDPTTRSASRRGPTGGTGAASASGPPRSWPGGARPWRTTGRDSSTRCSTSSSAASGPGVAEGSRHGCRST